MLGTVRWVLRIGLGYWVRRGVRYLCRVALSSRDVLSSDGTYHEACLDNGVVLAHRILGLCADSLRAQQRSAST